MKLKHLKLFENYTSDIIRMDIVKEVLDKIKNNNIDDIEEDPDMDSLLNPYDGYDQQTYIQYIDNNIIYWEGWSSYCWDALYEKPEYDGLSKEESIEKVIKERLIPTLESLGLKYFGHDYWFEESWTEGVEDGYIMKVIFEY